MPITLPAVLANLPREILALYDFSEAEYISAHKPVTGIRCTVHGLFNKRSDSLRRGEGCPACSLAAARAGGRLGRPAMLLSDVLARFPPTVLEHYDFSGARYCAEKSLVSGARCRVHGEFSRYTADLRKGRACPSCGNAARHAKARLSQGEAVAKAQETHGGFYDYSKTTYTTGRKNITVVCPVHGVFSIQAANHIHGGKGCPACSKVAQRPRHASGCRKAGERRRARYAAAFIAKARAVHGDAYTYDATAYGGSKAPVAITCPKHGPFIQRPEHHLRRAHGCPACSHHRSKGEAALVELLKPLTDVVERSRSIIAPKELDIYLPGSKLAIEYCGEYWHSAAKPEDEAAAKTRHRDKQEACEAQGIRLLTVFESEWLARPDAVTATILGAAGLDPRPPLMARKCELVRTGATEARDFFGLAHVQGGAGYGDHYGLRVDGALVACMRFTFGANDRGHGHVRGWTLSRYATSRRVVGGASRLFTAFLRETQPSVVKSFSDNRYFTGRMYAQLGFALEETLPPDYQVYHPKTGLLPKASWQRRKIPARIRDLGAQETFDPATDPRSERQMTYLLGARRLFDCGKKRWVWRAPG